MNYQGGDETASVHVGSETEPVHVLYANGDDGFAELVARRLSDISTEVRTSSVGTIEEALTRLADTSIDCLVTSYALPDGTGTELIETIESQGADVPTILFTGRHSEQVASEARAANVSAYIPIHANENSFDLLGRRLLALIEASRSEERAERMSDRFQRTLERTTEAIYAVDDEWCIEYMNETMADRLNRDKETVIGKTLWQEFPSIIGTTMEERYRVAMETGEAVSFEQYLPDPFDYWVDVRAFPDDDGLTIFSREITEERDRELQLKRSETILQTIHDMVFVLTDEGVVEFANSAARREVASNGSGEVEGQPLIDAIGDYVAESDADRLLDAVTSTLRGLDGETDRARLYDTDLQIDLERDGDDRTYDLRFTPFEAGENNEVLVVARDITEQVEREHDLKMANQRLESLINAPPLSVMEIDADGDILRWNDEAERVFGWSEEEVLGEYCPIIPEDYRPKYKSNRKKVLEGEWIRGQEVQRWDKNGKQLDMLLSVGPVTSPDGEINSMLAVLENITNQKQLERKLRALQQTAQRLSRAQSPETIGQIAVDSVTEILGFELAGVWECNDQADALVPIADTPGLQDIVGESPRFTPGDSLAWESFADGEIRVYDDVRTAEPLKNADTKIRSEILVPLGEYGLIATGSVDEAAFSETDVDLFRILGSTVEAAFGRASREAELKRQNERLDQFASVVAHDLRNPLSVAAGFTQLAKDTQDLDHLEKVEDAHVRIERLIEDLLTLAQGETTVTDTEELDIGTITTKAWGFVDTSEASLQVTDNVPVVAGDGGRLTQLFENLFRNAVEHGGKDVSVTVGRLDQDGGFYVEDDGDGIPEEKQSTVFEHGVTSNEGGTGFGLSIVDDIAKAHGWTVSVTDGSTGGARFNFETA